MHPLEARPAPPRLLPLALLLLATGCDYPGGTTIDEPPVGDETPALLTRIDGADHVAVATVDRVSAAFGRNEHGDDLIISTVTLRVHTTLRGQPAPVVSFELEGGAVGALRLEVSDLPTLRPGDRGLFALRRTAAGSWVPNRRGLGILRLQQLPDAQQLQRLQRAAQVSR